MTGSHHPEFRVAQKIILLQLGSSSYGGSITADVFSSRLYAVAEKIRDK